MALQSKYKSFAASPSAAALAPNASIHYVPTLVSLSGTAAIQRHFASQADQLQLKHNFMNVVEGPSSISVEAETTINFNFGGGAFLPGLDENFTADRIVTLPTVHNVAFDSNQNIQQIRLYWDQASLLKSVEVIGSRGKNWPVRDGKDQSRLVASSVDSSVDGQAAAASRDSSRPQSRVGANGDKHTSLSLFEKPQARVRSESPTMQVKPTPSAKPPQRDYHDLFAAGAELPEQGRPASPTKEYTGKLKSGAGKSYQPIRLFDEDEAPKSPPKSLKTDERKYQHFEFGEAEFQPKLPRHTKGMSQWAFEDFVTPQKPKSKNPPANSQRHIGWSDDEEDAQQPTVRREHNPKPRPDIVASNRALTAENDEPLDVRDLPTRPGASSRGKGMYESNVMDGAEEASGYAEGNKKPLANVTNVNPHAAAAHRKHFGSQFEIEDDSPADRPTENEGTEAHATAQKKPEAAKRASKHMQRHFEFTDEPSPARQRGINIQGDGMGSRKTGEKQWWDYE